MPIIAARFEGLESLLIFLVFIVISGISSWLQKRRGGGESPGERGPGEESSPGRGESGRRTIQSWEEELRRLLEGDRPEPEPPRQPVPPPLPTPAARRAPVASSEGPRISLLEESDQAYRNAQRRHKEAADRLKAARLRTERQRRKGGVVHSRPVRTDSIAKARALVSNPVSARQGIIASIVLGPPKGME